MVEKFFSQCLDKIVSGEIFAQMSHKKIYRNEWLPRKNQLFRPWRKKNPSLGKKRILIFFYLGRIILAFVVMQALYIQKRTRVPFFLIKTSCLTRNNECTSAELFRNELEWKVQVRAIRSLNSGLILIV